MFRDHACLLLPEPCPHLQHDCHKQAGFILVASSLSQVATLIYYPYTATAAATSSLLSESSRGCLLLVRRARGAPLASRRTHNLLSPFSTALPQAGHFRTI